MSRLVILGSAAAITDQVHENAYMVLDGPSGAILIDCAGSPAARLQQASVELANLRAIVLTHFHPDHVYGLPMLLVDLWLRGRRERLPVLGLQDAIDRARAMMDLFGWQDWHGFYPVDWIEITPNSENAQAQPNANETFFQTQDFRLYAAPTQHQIPSIAIKAMTQSTGQTLVYSSDTEPCQSVARLAQDADILIHEATGLLAPGHSSATAAGAIARQAGVGRLILIHYPTTIDPADTIAEVDQVFDGPTELAQDFQVIQL